MIRFLPWAIAVSYLGMLFVWMLWIRPSLGKHQTPIISKNAVIYAPFADGINALKFSLEDKSIPPFVILHSALMAVFIFSMTIAIVLSFIN